MANIRKSFNFKNGVQVDNDSFVINSNGLVGIGTSIPTEVLDLIGNAKITGLTTTTTFAVGSGATFYGVVDIGDISLNNSNGIVSATSFRGDGSLLDGVIAIATDGLIAQNNGLTTSTFIGLGTDFPEYPLQIGNNPLSGLGVGITYGSIIANEFSGPLIGTATTATQLESPRNFSISGDLYPQTISFDGTNDVSFASTLSNSFSANTSGIITASQFSGPLVGTSASATQLETPRNFSISGDLETQTISFDGTNDVSFASTLSNSFSANTSGIITASKFVGSIESNDINCGFAITTVELQANSIGVGTESPNADIHIRKSDIASLQVTSDTEYSIITLGENVNITSDNGQIRYGYGNALGDAEFSTEESFDVVNYGTGNLNFYLNPSGNGNDFNWLTNASTRAMVLTQSGNLGINSTTPSERLSVGGGATITGNLYVNNTITGNSIVKIGGTDGEFLKADGSIDTNVYLTGGNVLTEVVDDTSPTLGGELNLNGFNILDTVGSNISAFGDLSIGGTIAAGTDLSSKLVRIASGKIRGDNSGFYVGIGITDYPAEVPIGLGNTYVAISTSGNVYSTGIITATDGFSSGIGSAVQISVVGSTLTFNVVGVGSTSLTLF